MLELKRQTIAGFTGFTAQSRSPAASSAFLGKCISLLPKAAEAKRKLHGVQWGPSGETFLGVFSAHHISIVIWKDAQSPHAFAARAQQDWAVSASLITQPTPSHVETFAFSQHDYILEITLVCQQNNKHSFTVWIRCQLNNIFGYYLTPGYDLLT